MSFGGTNLLAGADANFEGSIGSWTSRGNCTLTDSATQAHSGVNSLKVAATSGATDVVPARLVTALIAGNTYVSSAWVFNAATTSRTVRINLEWQTGAGASTGTTQGTGIVCPASTWTQVTNPATAAPATTAQVFFEVLSQGANGVLAGDIYYVDDAFFGTAATVGHNVTTLRAAFY